MFRITVGFILLQFLSVGAYVLAPKSSKNPHDKRPDVYVAGFFPYADNVSESEIGRGVMPAVKLAVDHINENPSVLRNYFLHLWWNDTRCNAAVGMKALFDMIHEGPNKLMLFGAACTQVTDPIAKASKHWRLTQLSYADTHPMFTSENFPNFFRIVPSDNAFNLPRMRILQRFNWTRVGTIYQNEPRYSLAHNRLVADLDVLGYQIVETQSFANDVDSALNKLKDKDVRIILGNFNESWAREIFCRAHRFNMVGRKYQWLIIATYTPNWWLKPDDLRYSQFNCTYKEMNEALEGCIMTDLLPLSTNGEITISGSTADEYRLEYDLRRGPNYSRFHGYTYDGIWTVALAIQQVSRRIGHYRKNDSMLNFRYKDELWEELFLQALRNTSFEGVTGPVRFYNNERKANIMLKQFQAGEEVKIGEFNGITELLDLSRGHEIRWNGDIPPKDRTLQVYEHSHINLTVFFVLTAASCMGILLTIVFLVVNIKYRNQRYIKMSSPHLNNLIIIGCNLTYISVIFLGLDSQLTSIRFFPYVCTARAWLLMSGFSLAFGSMFSKTWRVHSIFTDVKLNKKVIKDYQLFMVVGVLVVIDLLIMLTWQITDPFYRETKQMEPYPDPFNDDILIVPENEYCQSERMTIFICAIYAYKGLLMVFGAFLAWETRHVSIPALNDSKYVGMSVYNVVIMCIMGAAVSFVLSDKQDAAFIIISVFILFCTTGTLCLVFVPKLVELRRNPLGIMDKRTRGTLRPISKSRKSSIVSELEEKINDAEEEVMKHRKELQETENELQTLMDQLGGEKEDDDRMLAIPSCSGVKPKVEDVPLKREVPVVIETAETSSVTSIDHVPEDQAQAAAPQVPVVQKKSSLKKTSFKVKEESILRREHRLQRARFENEKVKQPQSAKNVSFGPPEKTSKREIVGTHGKHPEAKTKSQLNLETLDAAQVHPVQMEEPHQSGEREDGKIKIQDLSYKDLQEKKIQEVTTLLTTQLLQKQEQPFTFESERRRSSIRGTDLVDPVPCHQPYRRTSVPNWGSNKIIFGEKKATKERKLLVLDRSWIEERRPLCPKHGGGFAEFTRSERESARAPDFQGFSSEKNIHERDSFRSYRVRKSFQGFGSSGGLKFIDKDEYWVTPADPFSRRTSGSLKGRASPFIFEDIRDVTASNVPTTAMDLALYEDPTTSSASEKMRLRYGSVKMRSVDTELPGLHPSIVGRGLVRQRTFEESTSGAPSCSNIGGNLTHVLSTPDVAAIRPLYDERILEIYGVDPRSRGQKGKQPPPGGHLCAAVSESELLDVSILPIFQKLLTERHKSKAGHGASAAAVSCPNISIKCDIVEYL